MCLNLFVRSTLLVALSELFTFVDTLHNSTLQADSVFLCSFDKSNLFTNVSLAETIDICANALYNSDLPTHRFHGKSSSNSWKLLQLELNIPSTKLRTHKSMEWLWDTHLVQLLQIPLLDFTKRNSLVTKMNHTFTNVMLTIHLWQL